jgi:putative hydrolase of the HAD superfamily
MRCCFQVALMLTAVLFDLDCTLVDRVHSVRQYAIRFAEDFRPRLVPISQEHIAEILIAADGWGYRPTTRSHDIAANLTWRVPPSLDEVTAHWNRHFPSLAVRMDGAVEALEALQALGLVLGLVTNGTVRAQEQKLEVLRLRRYFQAVVVSEAVGVQKPHPAIFQSALAGVSVAAEHAWFVGDHPENDILGASRAGLQTVWLASVHTWPTEHALPHYQINSLRELVPLIRGELAVARAS